MSQQMNDLKPLFLSAGEALALLDLCMLSHAEFDHEKEGVLLKLSDLVRRNILEEEQSALVRRQGDDSSAHCCDVGPYRQAHVESGLPPVAGADRPAGGPNDAQSAGLNSCLAGSFRSWSSAPAL